MKIIFVIAVLLACLIFAPAVFAGTFPAFDDVTQETVVYTLYGGGSGQEAWLTTYEDFQDGSAGDVLSGFGDIFGLTPTSAYGWYRIRGDVAGDLPEDAQDFVYGIQYNTDTTLGHFEPFLATEQVRWTTGPNIDVGYFGVGSDWDVNEDLKLRGAVWYDLDENYRVTGDVNYIPYGAVEVEGMVWLMIDRGDEWGLWRFQASHPVDGDMDVVMVYEDSTRSDAVFLIGFSYGL